MPDALRLFDDDEVLGPDLELVVHRGALAPEVADTAFARIRTEVRWRADDIVMFGRRTAVPRLQAWIGDPGATYTYSGIPLEPDPWPAGVGSVRQIVEPLAGSSFNSVLANLYRDGADSVSWHADDEPELGARPVIASVSLGATRRFQLRRRDDPADRREVELRHGDVVVMTGPTQGAWLHRVPKTATPVGARINLTFRTIVGPAG